MYFLIFECGRPASFLLGGLTTQIPALRQIWCVSPGRRHVLSADKTVETGPGNFSSGDEKNIVGDVVRAGAMSALGGTRGGVAEFLHDGAKISVTTNGQSRTARFHTQA